MSYNIDEEYFNQYFAGLEYNSCCWAIRMLGGRTYTGLNKQENPKFDNRIYIQFVLKGLGSYGKDDVQKLLSTHILGFNDHLV